MANSENDENSRNCENCGNSGNSGMWVARSALEYHITLSLSPYPQPNLLSPIAAISLTSYSWTLLTSQSPSILTFSSLSWSITRTDR